MRAFWLVEIAWIASLILLRAFTSIKQTTPPLVAIKSISPTGVLKFWQSILYPRILSHHLASRSVRFPRLFAKSPRALAADFAGGLGLLN